MHLVILTSLDALSRNGAAAALADATPGTPVILLDLLDDGMVTRRVHLDGALIERTSSVLEHGCLSCTVRLDLAPALLRLAASGAGRVVVGLPPGTTAQNALDGLDAVAPRAFTVDTVALAVRPDDVEDQLWDHHTLFASGYTAVPEDSRTPGEFLVGEFLFADTVLTTTSSVLTSDPALRARGLHLIGELAPHTRIVPADGTVGLASLGRFDDAAARSRSLPGEVLTPGKAAAGHAFRTMEHRVTRPLHPDRFRTALGAISEGCCFVRGSVWIAGMPDARIAVHGVGPRIALANGGSWQERDGEQRRGTHLALTGDDLDDADITGLLDACALTDDELRVLPSAKRRASRSRNT